MRASTSKLNYKLNKQQISFLKNLSYGQWKPESKILHYRVPLLCHSFFTCQSVYKGKKKVVISSDYPMLPYCIIRCIWHYLRSMDMSKSPESLPLIYTTRCMFFISGPLSSFGDNVFALKVKEWGTMWDSRLNKSMTIPNVIPQV